MTPLDYVVAGQQSNEVISWLDDLRVAFKEAQLTLFSNHTITLLKPDDLLWIVSDGAVRTPGFGATLYVTCGDKLHLAGFFSAQLRGSQVFWLPLNTEALSIATATKHFGPYIIQSNNNACILTDSKPCVQAFENFAAANFPPAYMFLPFSQSLVVSKPQLDRYLIQQFFRQTLPVTTGPLANMLPAKFAPLYTVSKNLWFDKPLSRTFSMAV